MRYLLIDSGTSNSRIRLCDEKGSFKSVSKQVGARDVAISGNNNVLKSSLRTCISEILKKNNIVISDIEAIIAAGMISSNVGLIDIPHISAPASITEIAKNLKTIYFPDIVDKEIIFIPGVKTGFNLENRLEEKDIMRGEETEMFGYLESEQEENCEEVLFMHYGSHHKCIKVSSGNIVESRTSITGELLMAIAQNTILKSSLIPIDQVNVNIGMVREGVKAAEVSGFGRALFTTRILDVMEKRTSQELTNFYLGVLLHMDLELISVLMTQYTKKIILYGKKLFPSITVDLIAERYPQIETITISEEQSDFLSSKGAIKIYKKSLTWR